MRRTRYGIATVVVSVAMMVVGCTPQSTWCNAELTHNNGRTWCAAGREPVIGGPPGSTQQIVVGAGVVPVVPGEGWATLQVSVGVTLNTHSQTVYFLSLNQVTDGIASGFGEGTFATGVADEQTTTMTLYADGQELVVSRGSVTITRFELRGPNPEGSSEGEAIHLTASYEADTDQGHVTGWVRIG